MHDLDPPSSMTYVVASRTLAQGYKAKNCEEGSSEPFRRSALSGQMQIWQNRPGRISPTTLWTRTRKTGNASRRLTDEADGEAIERILATLEVDCGRVS